MWSAVVLGYGSAATGAVLAASGMLAAGGPSAVPASNLRPTLGPLEIWFPFGNLVSRFLDKKALSRIAFRIATEGFCISAKMS